MLLATMASEAHLKGWHPSPDPTASLGSIRMRPPWPSEHLRGYGNSLEQHNWGGSSKLNCATWINLGP